MCSSWDFIGDSHEGIRDVLARAQLDGRSFSAWVREAMTSLSLKRNDVVHASCLNQTFAYQIIAGTRRPSRDKLIQLAFGMGFGIDEACELLERGGTNALRSSCRRDVVIAFALDRGLGVHGCDDLLWSVGERTIVTRGEAGEI